MQTSKVFAQFHYRRSPDQDRPDAARHRVVVVGAGPIGLAFAVDLAQRGHRVVVLDDSDRIGDGSRAICFSKRTLEIFDRLGVGAPSVAKGVVWQKGRVFHRERELYSFDLLPEAGHKMPAFINLQQYYVEGYLVDRAVALPLVDLRWRNKVVGLEQVCRPCAALDRNTGWSLCARCRLGDRVRWRAVAAAGRCSGSTSRASSSKTSF